MAGEGGDYGPSNFFDIVQFPEILMLRRKIFVLLLLVKTNFSNFIGKSLNLAPLLYRCHDAPGSIQQPFSNFLVTYLDNGEFSVFQDGI